MRVLIVASDTIPHVGGKSTHILDLADGFKKNNVEFDIISLKTLGRKIELAIKIQLIYYRIFNKYLFNYKFKKIWSGLLNEFVFNYCIKNHVDYISVQDAFAATSIKTTVQKLEIKTVLTMHTYFGIENALDMQLSKSDKKLYEKSLDYELQALDVVDGIIAVDERIERHVNDIVNEKKNGHTNVKRISSIVNFTNISKYNFPNIEVKKMYRNKLGLNDNHFVVICVRRMVEKNGVIYAVKAISSIKDDDIRLLIAGDGPQKPVIEKYIKDNHLENRVRLLGSLEGENIKKIYMAADISVVPSITVNGLQEATSISAIEAMACGLPVIASNIGGLPQLIENNKTGILVEEGNAYAIGEAIVALKQDKNFYSKISENARKHVEIYNSHVMASNEYINEFKKCSE
ncbi:MAG: glycosyltransferase family 4 protein [Acidaminococcaceae bacterium]